MKQGENKLLSAIAEDVDCRLVNWITENATFYATWSLMDALVKFEKRTKSDVQDLRSKMLGWKKIHG